jgi:starvation-inducible outer membrane lipoprotein
MKRAPFSIPDLEAQAYQLWRVSDTFANAMPIQIERNRKAITEARDKLNQALEAIT